MDEARANSFEEHLQRLQTSADNLEAKFRDTKAAISAPAATGDDEGMEVEYTGCYLDEDEEETEWWPEAVLGRRVVKNVLWYRIKWRGHNVVTWERDDAIENRKAVEEFEAAFKRRVEMPPTAQRRFVPPTYTSKRVLAARGESQSENSSASFGARIDAIWSCEVEPNIWIPYEDTTNRAIEQAYAARQPNVVIQIQGYGVATIDFGRMTQVLGASRRVQRAVRRPDDEERRHIDQMSLPELRRYIATVVEFTPVHYEVLSRLSELDKVPVHASKRDLDAIVKLTFAQLMERICEGFEFPGLTDECFICLDDYNGEATLGVLPTCGHVFHHKCIMDYLGKYSKLCPVCKQPIC